MILAILQARLSSRRLPGKVLMDVANKPMLVQQWLRIKQSRHIDKIVVATSHQQEDEAILATCRHYQINSFAGELNNVLKRFYDCASRFRPTHVVRLTADCPLADADLIDEVIEQHITAANDYTSNAFPRSYPDGLDVEILRFDSLKQIYLSATEPEQLEHVTPYVRLHPEQFKIGSVSCDEDLSAHRWTVDYPEDLQLIKKVFDALQPQDHYFGWRQVLTLLQQRPDLLALNRAHALDSV